MLDRERLPMTNGAMPWSTLFGLLFMTMGPIRAITVFSAFGESDDAPGQRALAARSVGLVAIAFTVALLLGDQTLTRWSVGLPALIAAAGIIIIVLLLQAILAPRSPMPQAGSAANMRAADVAFPGLFPPIAVALPIIFAAAAPGLTNKAIIFGLGMLVLALNWLAMRHAFSILKAIGPTSLQLFGAVFGVLQIALGIEFVLDAHRML